MDPSGHAPAWLFYCGSTLSLPMEIKLNGEKREVPDGLSVEGLLRHLNIEPRRVAVEINLNIIRKTEYNINLVKHGDSVEVVSFMGGGARQGRN